MPRVRKKSEPTSEYTALVSASGPASKPSTVRLLPLLLLDSSATDEADTIDASDVHQAVNKRSGQHEECRREHNLRRCQRGAKAAYDRRARSLSGLRFQ